jgi:ribosome modulation factor
MRGIEPDDSEMAYRRGYQAGVVETFHAVEQFLDPATREGLRAWIDDVTQWRTKAMLGSPPMWRLRILCHPKISIQRGREG